MQNDGEEVMQSRRGAHTVYADPIPILKLVPIDSITTKKELYSNETIDSLF